MHDQMVNPRGALRAAVASIFGFCGANRNSWPYYSGVETVTKFVKAKVGRGVAEPAASPCMDVEGHMLQLRALASRGIEGRRSKSALEKKARKQD